MLSLSRLLCGAGTAADALRYGRRSSELPAHLLHFSADKRPVVVWNVTRRCNLRCAHCYAAAADHAFSGELTTRDALAVVEDLASFGVPVVLFSGGEPLLRPDLFTLSQRARDCGMRAVLSTNGTLITPSVAHDVARQGFSYVGVSLDGPPALHDQFRGLAGAFAASMQGIVACQRAGVRVGVRFTLTAANQHELPAMLRLLEEHDIPRFCMYHLVRAAADVASPGVRPRTRRRGALSTCSATRCSSGSAAASRRRC
jgi:MoaA/NifB/PqqE/SkfB family radical SAM enzyme